MPFEKPDKPDFLTETHKVRYAYGKYELYYYIASCLLFFFLSYGLIEMGFLSDLFVREVTLQKLKEVNKELDNINRIELKHGTSRSLMERKAYLTKVKNELESEYPYVITIFHVYLKWKQKDEPKKRKIMFTLGYVMWYFLCVGVFVYFYRALQKKRDFFFQLPKTEEVFTFKKEKDFTLSDMYPEIKDAKVFQRYFTDPEKVSNFINSSLVLKKEGHFEKRVLKEGNYHRFVEEHLKDYLLYVETFYPFLLSKREDVSFYFKFLLWNYLINFYGNLPTGILTPYLKSDDFKIILGTYLRKLLPVIYVKTKKSPYSNEYKVTYLREKFFSYFFLRSLYEYDKIVGLFKTIEDRYSPFEFTLPITYQ